MPRLKILLTVTTYPLPSKSYDELVCTAGVTEDGKWIRIYPIPLSFLKELKLNGVLQPTKYTWIELDLVRRKDDKRPETYSPKNYDFRDLVVGEHLDTSSNWLLRRKQCVTNSKVYTNLTQLITESRKPGYKSLATFKPTKILGVSVEKEKEEDWSPELLQLKKQLDLFPINQSDSEAISKQIRKLPYKFYYRIEDDEGKSSRMSIRDWEIGMLYWNTLRRAGGNRDVAIEKVKQKYEQRFINNHDIYLFLGTSLKNHIKKAHNPFMIIGVFYPLKEAQGSLF